MKKEDTNLEQYFNKNFEKFSYRLINEEINERITYNVSEDKRVTLSAESFYKFLQKPLEITMSFYIKNLKQVVKDEFLNLLKVRATEENALEYAILEVLRKQFLIVVDSFLFVYRDVGGKDYKSNAVLKLLESNIKLTKENKEITKNLIRRKPKSEREKIYLKIIESLEKNKNNIKESKRGCILKVYDKLEEKEKEEAEISEDFGGFHNAFIGWFNRRPEYDKLRELYRKKGNQ